MSAEDKLGKGISRRSFIKGAVIGTAGIASASMLAGCSPKESGNQQSSAGENGAKKYSWETPPDPIPDSEIKETVEADVVVVGAGCQVCPQPLVQQKKGQGRSN